MFMHVIEFQYALHLVYVSVFSLLRHPGHTAEIVGMVSIGRHAVIEMEMEGAYTHHSACISKQSVIMAICKPAVKFELVHM